MEPATVRYCLLTMAAAAPRYAETPTPSRTEESPTNDLTSVTPNAYVASETGVAPAAVRAVERNET